MKKNKNDIVAIILYAIAIIILSAAVVSAIGMEIYCWVEYGNKPIDEVPTWVVWFLFGGRK